MAEEKEVKDDRRSFDFLVDGEIKTFYIDMPTSEQIRKAEWHYSKVYNKALVEGVATSSEMLDILTRRGIYGPEYNEKIRSLNNDIALKVIAMGDCKDELEKEKLAREIEPLRDELYRWNQRLIGPLSNSCEQIADDAKVEYLTSAVVQDEEGNLLWPSYEDFVAEERQGLALKARVEVMLWMQGLDSDFLEKTPERMVLQELALKRAEEAKKASTPKLEEPKTTEEEQPKKTTKRGRPSKAKKSAAKK